MPLDTDPSGYEDSYLKSILTNASQNTEITGSDILQPTTAFISEKLVQ